jgi:hypothetical protein
MARAVRVALCRRSERTATYKVVYHPWPQEVQQLRVAQQETLEPRVVQLGMLGPREAQHVSLRPHRAEISEGLSVRVEEPQLAQSPWEPLGWAGKPPRW